MRSIILCVESSHAKGMGHLLRVINIIGLLRKRKRKFLVVINNDKKSIQILRKRKIPFKIADLNNVKSGWESGLIEKYGAGLWINDRLDTKINHAKNVKNTGIKLVTLDDHGPGSQLADINFGGLPFNFNSKLKGKNRYKGLKYLVLNKEIKDYRRLRDKIRRVVISFGGSDTYGVTVKAVKILKNRGIAADVIVGPGFKHFKELKRAAGKDLSIKHYVPSLMKEFYNYDLAVTGGGITPFEANAAGLPCVIIANELNEIPNAKYLERLGSSIFAGYHKNISGKAFDLISKKGNIKKMSRKGMKHIPINGAYNIFKVIDHT